MYTLSWLLLLKTGGNLPPRLMAFQNGVNMSLRKDKIIATSIINHREKKRRARNSRRFSTVINFYQPFILCDPPVWVKSSSPRSYSHLNKSYKIFRGPYFSLKLGRFGTITGLPSLESRELSSSWMVSIFTCWRRRCS